MTTSTLSQLAARYRTKLQQRDAQDARMLTDAHTAMLQQVQPSLTHLYADIEAKQREVSSAQESDERAAIPLGWLLENNRLDRVKQTVTTAVNKFAALARVTVQQMYTWVRSLGYQAAHSFLSASSLDGAPTALAPSMPTERNLFGNFADDAAKAVHGELYAGLLLDSPIKEIAASITRVLDAPRWRALTIAKTELFQHFNDTLLLSYRYNARIVDGWVWNCRLSSHSCVACVALHGTIHKLDEILVDHPNGQCFATPYVAGMPEIQSGVDWFEAQDVQTKREILGSQSAYDLYSTGQATLHDFVGVRHDHGYEPSVYQKSVKQMAGRK